MANSKKRSARRTTTSKSIAPGGSTNIRRPLESDDGDITIFLSYARDDDSAYKMVSPFKHLLGHFIYAKSGRKIRTFLDQQDIRWGDVWRDRLDAEIRGASVFIPLLSAAYLDSDNCRMEFNRFKNSARALGVSELLLPVLLVHAPAIFNEGSADDVVRESAARQWEPIEEAILSDPGSSEWKRTMARLADRFVEAIEAAEAKLGEQDDAGGSAGLANLVAVEDDEDDLEAPGLAELMESLNEHVATLLGTSEEMGPAIAGLGGAAESAGPLGSQPSIKDVQLWSLRSAQGFKPAAEKINEVGERMFVATNELDLDLQQLRQIAIDLLSVQPVMAETYNTMVGKLAGLDSVTVQLEGLLSQMQPAESFSVPLRKALRPARLGLTRVTDSLRIIDTWRPIEVD